MAQSPHRMTKFLANGANALFATNRRVLRLSRFLGRTVIPKTPTLMIVSMPKSGSTLLAACLRRVTGYRGAFLGAHPMSHQDLLEAAVLDNQAVPVVVNQHCSATKPTLELLRRHGLKPVFLCRRIEDQLMSIHDKLESDPWITPSYAAGPAFLALDRNEKLDRIISLAAPRYIDSFASWQTALARGDAEGLVLSYEDMVADKPGTVKSVAAHFGITLSDSAAAEAVRAVEGDGGTRFNKGVVGRGQGALLDRHREALNRLTDPFPWVDFSKIGLRPAMDDASTLTRSPLETSV